MVNQAKLREWVTPLVIGAFTLTAITGILLFFKVSFGLIKPAHEWLSWLLVVGAVLHVVVNWRPCVNCATKPKGKLILALFLVLICLCFVPVGGKGRRSHPMGKVDDVLSRASVSAIAQLKNEEPERLIEVLRAKGLAVDN